MSFFLAYKLRKASDTLGIEKKRDTLRSDFEEFEAFSKSEELKDYNDLEKYVLSEEFKRNRKSIESKNFKKSELFKEEKKLKHLQRSKKFKIFFRLKDSKEISYHEELENSEELRRYKELTSLLTSPSFNKKEQAAELKEYKTLKKSKRIKSYFKFKKSKAYQTFREIDNSKSLEDYYSLEEKVNSEAFKEEKKFLLDKKRFEQTEEYQKLTKYQELKNSDKFKKYFALKKKNSFGELYKWELSFSEEFDTGKLDESKWLTKYFWGEELMNKTYSLESDLHIFTDGKNIDHNGSSVVLQARKEKYEGLQWDTSRGFVPGEFDYTSAIVNTGKSFRQKYGRFEAKIKLTKANQVAHSFWMVADKKCPHIDVLNTGNGGKLYVGNYWGNENLPNSEQYRIKGVDLSKGYFIYSLDWTPTELIWKINDVVVRKQTKGIPQDPMYLNFCLGVTKEQTSLNASFEIDWVRCYKRKD